MDEKPMELQHQKTSLLLAKVCVPVTLSSFKKPVHLYIRV
jgi:hypothetical protein